MADFLNDLEAFVTEQVDKKVKERVQEHNHMMSKNSSEFEEKVENQVKVTNQLLLSAIEMYTKEIQVIQNKMVEIVRVLDEMKKTQ